MKANETYVLFTDSASDLTEQVASGMGVSLLYLNVFMKDSPAQACTLRGSDFYDALRNGKVACTSAANLSHIREKFEAVLKTGRDILYLAFSSTLSSMYATAQIVAEELAEEYPERKIRIVDTRCGSLGQGLLVYLCAERKGHGASLDEAAAFAENNHEKVRHWFTVEDLMYLRRGGRVGTLSAFAGVLLGIKPILLLNHRGILNAMQKVRGKKNAVTAMIKHYEEEVLDENSIIYIGHTDAPELAEQLRDILKKEYGIQQIVIGMIGPVIGAHAGPGAVAVFYLGKHDTASA
ncbi:MAG: DegV family protein [Oscillospiraceae bacterium]|nr:DegV family protein [Oscillospiraceae bacterium]